MSGTCDVGRVVTSSLTTVAAHVELVLQFRGPISILLPGNTS